MTSPTLLVKDAMAHGAASREAIARRTKLHSGTVDLILERLERSGEIYRELLSTCAAGGCSSCLAVEHCAVSTQGDGQRGLMLLKLRDAV